MMLLVCTTTYVVSTYGLSIVMHTSYSLTSLSFFHLRLSHCMYSNVLKIPKMIPAFRSSMLTMAADTQATNKINVSYLVVIL